MTWERVDTVITKHAQVSTWRLSWCSQLTRRTHPCWEFYRAHAESTHSFQAQFLVHLNHQGWTAWEQHNSFHVAASSASSYRDTVLKQHRNMSHTHRRPRCCHAADHTPLEHHGQQPLQQGSRTEGKMRQDSTGLRTELLIKDEMLSGWDRELNNGKSWPVSHRAEFIFTIVQLRFSFQWQEIYFIQSPPSPILNSVIM